MACTDKNMDKLANIYEVFHLADPARGQQVDGYGPNFLWNFLKILPRGHVIWPLSSAQLMVHNKIVEVPKLEKSCHVLNVFQLGGHAHCPYVDGYA